MDYVKAMCASGSSLCGGQRAEIAPQTGRQDAPNYSMERVGDRLYGGQSLSADVGNPRVHCLEVAIE